jgi:hypothetical protein
LARNTFLGLPFKPCASACFEHSIDSGLRGCVAAFLVLAVAGGGVVEGVVYAMAALAQNEPTNAAMRSLRMKGPCCCGWEFLFTGRLAPLLLNTA